MKTKLTLLVVLALLCTLGCRSEEKIKGNGVKITRNIELAAFDKIQYSGNIEWAHPNRSGDQTPVFEYTSESGNPSVQVITDENLYPYLSIQVTNGKLSLQVRDNVKIRPTVFIVRASSESLSELQASGSLDFALKSPISGEQLKIKASGATDIYLKHPVRYTKFILNASGASDVSVKDLECRNIECYSSGASDITLAGKAVNGLLKASGSGDIGAYKLQVENLECIASGSGDIEAYATEKINAKASGSGDIAYKGKPSQVQRHESGAGEISKK